MRTDVWLEHITVQMVAAVNKGVQQQVACRARGSIARVLKHADNVAVALHRYASGTVPVQEGTRAALGQSIDALRVHHRTVAVRRARRIQRLRVGCIIRRLAQTEVWRTTLCGFGSDFRR